MLTIGIVSFEQLGPVFDFLSSPQVQQQKSEEVTIDNLGIIFLISPQKAYVVGTG